MSNPIKRHGGKQYLSQRIRELFPSHTRYCETHFGAGAVLLAGNGDGVAEYANDKDKILQTFWYVLSDPSLSKDFIRRANMTPFAEPVFDDAKQRIATVRHCIRVPVIETALDFFVVCRQSRQALGNDFATPTSRLRRDMNEQVSAWLSAVDGLPETHARLRRVEIRCMDAVDFIKELDSPETLFYADPPYQHETRSSVGEYGEHEMSFDDHVELLNTLGAIQGRFVLSGYRSELYDSFAEFCGWHRVEFDIANHAASGKTKERKTECCWMNFKPGAAK